MKVLLLNTFDYRGGAAKAAYRLLKSLQGFGINSNMLVQHKSIDDNTVIGPNGNFDKLQAVIRYQLDRTLIRLYKNRKNVSFSTMIFGNNVIHKINKLDPDIVNIHYINGGFINIRKIAQIRKPIVWTLHDMWAFTGGCHIDNNCGSYQNFCGNCPLLGSKYRYDLSSLILFLKRRYWANVNMTIVSPSLWLKNCAKKSTIFKNNRIDVIPNSIDKDIFKPINKQRAQQILGLPQNKKFILFGSLHVLNDKNKGFDLFASALKKLSESNVKNVEIIGFGTSNAFTIPNCYLKYHNFGTMNDEISMALLYSAADVFVVPSIHENLPNTVMESLACGTPVVAFCVGGIPDMIDHMDNGYLAKPYQINDLANGIELIINNDSLTKVMSKKARETVELKYTYLIQAKNYVNLFNSILANKE